MILNDEERSKARNNAYKTAIVRTKLSAPTRYLVEHNLLVGRCMDFGCGQGFDARELGIFGYDPYWNNVNEDKILNHNYVFDTIICNYVLNVLPPSEWKNIVAEIRRYLAAGGIAYITVRNDRKNLRGFTKRGTYQTHVRLPLPIERECSTYTIYRLEPDYHVS